MDDESTYEEDQEIDKYDLHNEWAGQAGLYMKWAKRYSRAVKERDKAKENLNLVRAEVDAKIRDTSSPKPTEAAISSLVIQNKKYRIASTALIKATENMNVMDGAKEAMNHRKKGLENEVILFLAGYYVDPNIPKKYSEQLARGTSEGIKRQLKENKRLRARRHEGKSESDPFLEGIAGRGIKRKSKNGRRSE